MKSRSRKGPRKALKVSFLATFGILVIILVGTLVYTQETSIPVKHLPTTVPTYHAGWAKYVSKNVIQFSFQNYTYVNSLNSSLPFFGTILKLNDPVVEVNTTNVRFFVSMEFQTPNASVDIAYLQPSSFDSFTSKFANLTAFAHHLGNDSLYQVEDVATKKTILGWLAIMPQDEAVAFAPGLSEAEQGLTEALNVPTQSNSSIIGLPDIRQMLYLSGGASGHIAIGLNSFAGTVASSLKTMTTVDQRNSGLNLTRVVEYPDFHTAYSQFSNVKLQYPNAAYIIVFDPYVRASQIDALRKLGGDYRLVQ